MKKKEAQTVNDLIPDDKNYNKGNEKGGALIKKSISKLGAGRSILIDKNNRIIAGNKTVENAIASGLIDLQIVETTGDKIIAVKRTDIDLDSKKGRELALADNATAKANIEWDAEALNEDWSKEELDDWGVITGFETEPSYEDLIGEDKNKPPCMKITFPSVDDLQDCETEIQEVINRKCPKAFYSVSAGEL
jgi:sporulation protein YlmC with PRC-barrel domain